jgi:hypothetical protein
VFSAAGHDRRQFGRNAPVCLFLPFQRRFGPANAGAGRQIGHHRVVHAMHDPVDIRRRIERLIARVDRRDDYGQLLASGQVVHGLDEVVDVDAWRAEIRRQARADKIKGRTGSNDGLVWALRLAGTNPRGGRDCHRPPVISGRALVGGPPKREADATLHRLKTLAERD